jgi:GR25 family glycosyltransferase involved in LPS biosynthesis
MDKISKQHLIINLDKRPERLEKVSEEFKKIGINKINRFKAIEHEVGLIGCGESHKRCIEIAIENGWDFVAIFEDDVFFPDPESFKRLIEKYMKYKFDVLFLGARILDGVLVHDDLIKVKKAYLMHGYIVRCNYYLRFLENLRNGLRLKKDDPSKHTGNCDEYINHIIAQDRWYCLYPCQASQRDGYSDNFNKISQQQYYISNPCFTPHVVQKLI